MNLVYCFCELTLLFSSHRTHKQDFRKWFKPLYKFEHDFQNSVSEKEYFQKDNTLFFFSLYRLTVLISGVFLYLEPTFSVTQIVNILEII